MKKHGVNKFIGLLLPLSLITSMLFSFVSFAEAYTGAYLYTGVDPVTGLPITEVRGVNPTGQTFSGENKIEMNAYNNAPILTDNTFNGSTDIDTAFTDITSNGNTYNGTTTLEYSSVTGGTLQSSADTFAATSVEASDADVEISNGTFNGALSINANSVSLGSISQMDDLIIQIMLFRKLMMDGAIAVNVGASQPYPTLNCTVNYNGKTVTEPFPYYTVEVLSPNSNSTDLSTTLYRYRSSYINALLTGFTYTFRNMSTTCKFILNQRRTFYNYSMSVDASGEYFSLTKNSGTYSFSEMVENRFSILIDVVNFWFQRFYNWYYPLDNVLPEYWRVYNTDTQEQEDIGLAGLMYNISWYLGQLYALQVESGPLTQLSEDVDDAAESMASMEAQEEAVISSISSGISSFVPDLSELGAFTALAWCSNYLQQCWVSLGMYGTVIMIGLLLAVCMQFIGYFRYK